MVKISNVKDRIIQYPLEVTFWHRDPLNEKKLSVSVLFEVGDLCSPFLTSIGLDEDQVIPNLVLSEVDIESQVMHAIFDTDLFIAY